jgi:MFS transporter, DHA3 family, macrolide efflux protein
MGLILVVFGFLNALVGLSGYLFPAIRRAEDLLPDHAAPITPTDIASDEPSSAPNPV